MRAGVDGWRRMLIVAALVVGLDQIAKAIVTASLVPAQRVDVALGIRITYIHNKGVAFGLLDRSPGLMLALVLAAVALVLLYFARNPGLPRLWLPVGLLIGGALGNLADRARLDSVIDFIKLPVWPAFNLADVAIVAGLLTLIWVYESSRNRPREGQGDAGR